MARNIETTARRRTKMSAGVIGVVMLVACSTEVSAPPLPPTASSEASPPATPPDIGHLPDPPRPIYPRAGYLHREGNQLLLDGCFRASNPTETKGVDAFRSPAVNINTIQNMAAARGKDGTPQAGQVGVIAVLLNSEAESVDGKTFSFITDASIKPMSLVHPVGEAYHHNKRNQDVVCRTILPSDINFPDFAINSLVIVKRDPKNNIVGVRGPFNDTTRPVDPENPKFNALVTDIPGVGTLDMAEQPPFK